MGTAYEQDIIAWAKEQAALLRAGKLAEIDRAHIAEEIEDVGKSEQRELASRLAVLLAHLLKWQYQPLRVYSKSLRAGARQGGRSTETGAYTDICEDFEHRPTQYGTRAVDFGLTLRRGASWQATIQTQRNSIKRRLSKTPSLQTVLSDVDGWADGWDDARAAATQETGIAFTVFPKTCPWSIEQVLSATFYPD